MTTEQMVTESTDRDELERRETASLIGSDKVEGMAVYSTDGQKNWQHRTIDGSAARSSQRLPLFPRGCAQFFTLFS